MEEHTNYRKEFISLIVLILLSVGTALVLFQCKKAPVANTSGTTGGGPGTNEVWITSAYNPSSITVTQNTTITWINKDNMAHTVTSTSGAFDSGSISPGATYTRTFATAGTFPYLCSFHSNMTGTVIVK